MADLPTKSHLTSNTTTEAQFQGAIGGLYDYVAQLLSGSPPEVNTLSSDAITPNSTFIHVDTEAAASSDFLKNIVPTNLGNKVIFVRSVSNIRSVVINHLAGGTGQILLNGATSATLDHTGKLIAFVYDSANTRWVELWRNWGLYTPGASDLSAVTTLLGLGTAAYLNHGTSSGQVPRNSDLGALAYLAALDNTNQITNGIITGAKLANATLALAKLADDSPGAIPVFNASGVASKITAGAVGEVLTGNGAGQPASFQTLSIPSQSCELIYTNTLNGVNSRVVTWDNGEYEGVIVSVTGARVGTSDTTCMRLYSSGSQISSNAYYSKVVGEAEPGVLNRWVLGTPTNSGSSSVLGLCCETKLFGLSNTLTSNPYYTGSRLNNTPGTVEMLVGRLSVQNVIGSGLNVFNMSGNNFSAGRLTVWGFK